MAIVVTDLSEDPFSSPALPFNQVRAIAPSITDSNTLAAASVGLVMFSLEFCDYGILGLNIPIPEADPLQCNASQILRFTLTTLQYKRTPRAKVADNISQTLPTFTQRLRQV